MVSFSDYMPDSSEFDMVACCQSRLFTTKHTKMHEGNQNKLINQRFVSFVNFVVESDLEQ